MADESRAIVEDLFDVHPVNRATRAEMAFY
jgi:hypothetical protein